MLKALTVKGLSVLSFTRILTVVKVF